MPKVLPAVLPYFCHFSSRLRFPCFPFPSTRIAGGGSEFENDTEGEISFLFKQRSSGADGLFCWRAKRWDQAPPTIAITKTYIDIYTHARTN